jgi:small multidrug resistance family-3 protein
MSTTARIHRAAFIAASVVAPWRLRLRRCVPTRPHFGRILAAYGGVFVADSLAWDMIIDMFRPDRWDLIGAVSRSSASR